MAGFLRRPFRFEVEPVKYSVHYPDYKRTKHRTAWATDQLVYAQGLIQDFLEGKGRKKKGKWGIGFGMGVNPPLLSVLNSTPFPRLWWNLA